MNADAMIKRRVTFSPEQDAVLLAINDRMRAGLPSTVLHGLAGCGKTTVVAEFARANRDTLVVAFTGKAASVLRAKTGLPAATIHSAFYQLLDAVEEDDGRPRRLTFGPRFRDGELRGTAVVIDECSQVHAEMAHDILRTGAHVIACGDPGQLPPVSGAPYFAAPDLELREIHRQALESPIIRQAHAVRRGEPYRADGDAFRVVATPSDADLLDADTLLCHTNATRARLNQRMRRLHGMDGHPQPGEPVLCLQNARTFGIYNGAVYELAEPFPPGSRSIALWVDGQRVAVPNVEFAGAEMPRRRDRIGNIVRPTSKFDYGYALTVHKSQGSEWPNVLLIDEYRHPDNRREWLYTGITRASGRITVAGAPT